MSWINDIAGKAEDLLNKIDHGAATVLNKEKSKKNKMIEIMKENIASEQAVVGKYSPPAVKKPTFSSPSTIPERNIPPPSDDPILNYLNNSEVDIDSLKEKINEKGDICLNKEEPEPLEIVLEESGRTFGLPSRSDENQLLRNEVRSLSTEVGLLLSRSKSSERELALVKSLLCKKESEVVVLEKEILSLKQRLNNAESENSQLYNENLRLKSEKEIDENERDERKLSEIELEHQKREDAFKGDIAALRIRVNEVEQCLLKAKSESSKELSEVNTRLSEARQELEDYRAKAQWTLAEKDKLINALRNKDSHDSSDHLHTLELQQLREERDKLVDELEEVRSKLERSRKEELEAERRLEGVREETAAAVRTAQARLAEETARRLAAEEHSVSHAEELQSVREELWRQVSSLNARLKERERELSRLRRQLSERVISRPEPELTAALVQKQETIQLLTGEISQLRLQLDRAKVMFGDIGNECRRINVNDTDDAKAQVPLMGQGPRRMLEVGVKRAWRCVSSLRIGRRHPISRLAVYSYLTALHIWLFIVLFSYTPENH